MEEKKVYLVYPGGAYYSTPLAIFEDKRKAVAFTKRFKVNPDYDIVKQPLNPSFRQDPTISPYKVAFFGKFTVEITLSSDSEDVEHALARDYMIEEHGLFLYVLAVDQAAAILEASKMRDELIRAGEWEL